MSTAATAIAYKNNNNIRNTTNVDNNSLNTGLNDLRTSSNQSNGGADRVEWSRATILGFIEDYRRQRVLWDPNTKGYHIKQTKYEALKALGQKYGAEIRSIRSKIKSLRSSFHREHGKVINGRRKGLNYQPMWFAYNAIRFILDGESGDFDETEPVKHHDVPDRELSLQTTSPTAIEAAGWGSLSGDSDMLQERKLSSRDIEQFNNHFLALGLQARHPMVMMAAAAEAVVAAAAQGIRQEQLDQTRKQQQQQHDSKQLDSSQLKALELTAVNSISPISLSSPKSLVKLLNNNTKPLSLMEGNIVATTSSSPPSSTTTTYSPENVHVLHGARSLDDSLTVASAAAVSAAAVAAAAASLPPSLTITSVAREANDFDGDDSYCNISADDVKTEIIESDTTELTMLEHTNSSTSVPLNYHRNAIDASVSTATGSGRKRKAQTFSTATHAIEKGPSPSKLHNQQQQQHQQQQQSNQNQNSEKQISVVKIENSELNTINKIVIDTELVNDNNEKMVQKPSNGNVSITGNATQTSSNKNSSNNSNNHNNNNNAASAITSTSATSTNAITTTTTSGSTTVTELNVSNPNYLYYVMSSGQFSPCDTLDSGTGSDLESNGQQQNSLSHTQTTNVSTSVKPNLEMHLKAAKMRVNNTPISLNHHHKHQTCNFTDSEESEASSLSCDSLHSNEFIRQSSTSPINKNKILGSFLPDSLLRDIRGLKFQNHDYEAENEEEEEERNSPTNKSDNIYEPINTQDYLVTHNDFVQTRNCNNHTQNNNTSATDLLSSSVKRASLPSKTFHLNPENGTFVDTKMNSMPRKYEADRYYKFHINEHDNLRSYGTQSTNGDTTDSFNYADDYDTRSLHDDAFAGYKDLRCGSATSTIRSSKGTVRGVKNRVRNGIATFLQLQQPNIKNYKEKDSGKVVLYTTSMGIIRDTYAKCSNVKQILRTLLVKFEERDVFMSLEYQQEIKERMHSDIIKVPQLFVEGQHIGDAETVERLNESGELRQLLKPYKSIATAYTCQTCGGYRLLPCPSCNGSKKSVHRNHFTAEFVALKCMNCDEVGLVKCHNC